MAQERPIAGAFAVAVSIGTWLLTCTTLLALFLALSKRRHVLILLGEDAVDHRRIFDEHSPYLLDQRIPVVTASTLIAYATFAISADTAQRLGTQRLDVTIPLVLYGIFRYFDSCIKSAGVGARRTFWPLTAHSWPA